jgi:regulator of protease activity HflC (stomatin/prohibitin superfamily)
MNVAGLIQILATLSWLIVIGAIILAVAQASRGRAVRGTTTLIVVFLVAALILTGLGAGVVFISPEERGVVISAVQAQGVRPQALTPGLRWIIPFLETVQRYPISRQNYTMSIAQSEGQIQGDDSITARTSDGQELFIDASIIFAIDPTKVVQVHIEWQDRYSGELVRPLARGVIRDAISQFGVEEVVTSKRFEMQQMIEEAMAEQLAKNGLTLVSFLLRNITFSPEYAASVEAKQVAEQQAQAAFFVVEQRKQEAEQARQVAQGSADASVIRSKGEAEARLIQAEAEAKALLLIADALADNPDLLTYNYISKLAPGIQVMLVPNNAPFLLPLDSLPTLSSTPAASPNPAPTPEPTPEPTAPAAPN